MTLTLPPATRPEGKATYRRTVELDENRREEIEEIRAATGATTDSKAISDAISFYAPVAKLPPAEVKAALTLVHETDIREVKSVLELLKDRNLGELQYALGLLQTMRSRVADGYRVIMVPCSAHAPESSGQQRPGHPASFEVELPVFVP